MTKTKAPRIILYPNGYGRDGVETHRVINKAAELAGQSVSSWGIRILYVAAKRQVEAKK